MLYANEQGHDIWGGERGAKGNKESLKKYEKPKIVGSTTLEIHYVMLTATLKFE